MSRYLPDEGEAGDGSNGGEGGGCEKHLIQKKHWVEKPEAWESLLQEVWHGEVMTYGWVAEFVVGNIGRG